MYRADHARAGRPASRELEFVLGPTHEEIITPLVKAEITSYRDLPKNFYQIATKFRNKIRPRYGLMRAREFVMKDAYSFDADDEGAVRSYHAMEEAYARFFARCGLKTISVEADTGVMAAASPRVDGAGGGRGRRRGLLRGERLRGEPREGHERARAGDLAMRRRGPGRGVSDAGGCHHCRARRAATAWRRSASSRPCSMWATAGCLP